MKNKLRFRILLFFTILCMVGIFLFSSKPADESSKMSHEVGMFLCRIFVPGYDGWSKEEQNRLADKIDYPIRKAAHATEYTVLGMFLYGTLISGGRIISPNKNLFLAILTGAIYSTTDEIHQLFVPGRAGLFTDVLIDTAGVTLGAALIYLLMKKQKVNKKNKGLKGKLNEQ